MKETTIITICGKQHVVSYGIFGERLIDGLTYDKFVETLNEDELFEIVRLGAREASKNTARFKEYIQSHEISDERAAELIHLADLIHQASEDVDYD